MSLYDPRNRKELYYKGILDNDQGLPEPRTREEMYLKAIAEKDPIAVEAEVRQESGTSATDVMSQKAVTELVTSSFTEDGMVFVTPELNVRSTSFDINNGRISISSPTPYKYCGFRTTHLTAKYIIENDINSQLWIGCVYENGKFVTQSICNVSSASNIRFFDQSGTKSNFLDCTFTHSPVTPGYETLIDIDAVYENGTFTVKANGNNVLVINFNYPDWVMGIGFLSYGLNTYCPFDVKVYNESRDISVISSKTENVTNSVASVFSTSENVTDLTEETLSSGKYWGNGGLLSANGYYALSSLISTSTGRVILKDFGEYGGAASAIIGAYAENGTDSPGRINLNSSYIVSYTLDEGILKEVIIDLAGSGAKKVGLFFKNYAPLTNLGYTPRAIIDDTLVTFTNAGVEAIKNIIREEIPTLDTVGDAFYYQKGASPKLPRTKKLCIIGAGQSNIDGRVPAADLPDDITLPMSGMYYIKNSTAGDFSNAFPSVSYWGFDLVTCKNLINNLGAGNLYYIKWSQGGTAIDPSSTSSTYYWTADYEELPSLSDSLLYSYNLEIQKCGEENPDDYEIGAMIWHQGEGDYYGFSPTAPGNYYDNFKHLISYCRGIVGNSRLPFICGTVSHNSDQYDPDVEAAVLRLADEDPYLYVVDMSNAALLDDYHFNAAWSEYLGDKVYDCLIDAGVITGTKINPSEPT